MGEMPLVITIIFMLLIPITQIYFAFIFITLIVKTILRGINKKFFKNNVVNISKTIKNTFDNNQVTYKDAFKEKYTDIEKEELATFNTDDLEAFKNFFYKIFVDFENAYNNLDYNTMKTLSTKQLFHNYYTGITLDLEVGKKRIISNIQKKNVIIFETFTSTAKQVVSTMIEISYINYTMNKNGIVISGDRDKKVTEKFEVIFRKDFERNDIVSCPNCGAEVVGNKCEYCRTNLKNVSFKISSIKKIVDR